MLGVGRDLCGSSNPTPLPKQGHREQVAKDLIQAGFEYLQRRRIHNLPGQPVPVLHHPQSEEVLPHVQLELLEVKLDTLGWYGNVDYVASQRSDRCKSHLRL